MLNPPNLSEATEPLKPEASRHSTCSPHSCPLALAGPLPRVSQGCGLTP